MPGKIQSNETTQTKKGPKNTLLGVKPLPLLMWQLTDRKGNIHTELGVEMSPGNIRKLPTDIMKNAGPVGNKLQQLLFEKLHPEQAAATSDKPAAAPVGITPKEAAASKLPEDSLEAP